MPIKKCSVCRIEKDLSEFHLDKVGTFGVKSICKECRKKHRTKQNKNLILFYDSMMRGIFRGLKNNKNTLCFKFLDFTYKELKEHLEGLFFDDMNWDNFGVIWGIDFIIPKKFYRSHYEIKKCFSLKNMRPLHLTAIRVKQGRFFMEDIEEYDLFDIMPLGGIIY